jgi:hypothetical protein
VTTRDYITNFKDTHGRLPSQVELSRELKLSANHALQALIQYTKEGGLTEKKEKEAVIRKDRTIVLLKVFLVLLSAMAFILSVYFTGLWFYGKFSIFISGLISLTMVMFMVIAPQTLRFVENRLIKVVVVFSFTVAMVFSMGSTVAGQYRAITDKMETQPDSSFVFKQLSSSEEELVELIEEAKADKEVHQTSINLLSSTEDSRLKNWQSISTERKYIEAFDNRIDELRAELAEVRGQQMVTGTVTEKRDFYYFISSLTGADQTIVEFIISALPAVFIDVVSALCLNLALFIGRRKDEKTVN